MTYKELNNLGSDERIVINRPKDLTESPTWTMEMDTLLYDKKVIWKSEIQSISKIGNEIRMNGWFFNIGWLTIENETCDQFNKRCQL